MADTLDLQLVHALYSYGPFVKFSICLINMVTICNAFSLTSTKQQKWQVPFHEVSNTLSNTVLSEVKGGHRITG